MRLGSHINGQSFGLMRIQSPISMHSDSQTASKSTISASIITPEFLEVQTSNVVCPSNILELTETHCGSLQY